MATIDSLVEATVIGDDDLFLVDQGGEGKKIKRGNISVPHDKTLNRNAVGAHDAIYDRHVATAAEVAGLGLSDGDYIWIDERRAGFKVKTDTPNGFDKVDAGNGNTAILAVYDVYYPEYFGHDGEATTDVRPYMYAMQERFRRDGGGKFSGFEGRHYYTSLQDFGSVRHGVIFDVDNVTWLRGGTWGLMDGQLTPADLSVSSLHWGFKRPDLGELHEIYIDDVVYDGNLRGQEGHFGLNSAVASHDTLTIYNVKSGKTTATITDFCDSGCFAVAGSDYKIDINGKGNWIWKTDAAISSGSNALTSVSGGFTEDDVGKKIIIIGAGSFAGAGANNALLNTAVTGYVSPTEVLLQDNALTTVSGARAFYGSTDSTLYLSGNGTSGTTVPAPTPSLGAVNGILPTRINAVVNSNDTYSALHCLRGLRNSVVSVMGKNHAVGVDHSIVDNVDGYPSRNSIVNCDFENIAYTPIFCELSYNLICSNNRAINCWTGAIMSGVEDSIISANNFSGMFGATQLGNNAGIILNEALRNGVYYASKNNIVSDNRIKGFWNGIIDNNGVWNIYNDNFPTYTRNSVTSVTGQYVFPAFNFHLNGVWVVENDAARGAYPVPQVVGSIAKVYNKFGISVFDPNLTWTSIGHKSGSSTITSSAGITINHGLGVTPSMVTIMYTATGMAPAGWWYDASASDSNNMTIRFSSAISGTFKWTTSL